MKEMLDFEGLAPDCQTREMGVQRFRASRPRHGIWFLRCDFTWRDPEDALIHHSLHITFNRMFLGS
jgi:hypothetical protein